MHHKINLYKDIKLRIRNNKKSLLFLLALLVISTVPAFLLFKPGFPITDDGTWLIIRFSGFFETLRSGQIPVRFIYRLNDGLGYPVSNFLYPLYLYLATPIHALGFNFLNSIKILIILNIYLSSIFTFLWLNKKFSKVASFLGACVLVLSPYFLFDIYNRGSVGEILTFSIVPFIFWQIERKNLPLISIGIFFLILAHNTLAIFFITLILLYVILNKLDLKLIFKSLLLGLGLSSFFWIPAIFDLSSTIFFDTKVSSFYDYLFKLTDINLIGLCAVIILVVSALIAFKYKKTRKDLFFIFSILISIFIIFVQFPQSKIFWEIFPFKDFIQFPFRLLSVLSILLAFLAAFTTDIFKKYKIYYVLLLLVLLFIQSLIFLKDIEFQIYEDSFYSTNMASTTVLNEYRNKWLINPESGSEIIEIASGKGLVESSYINFGKINFDVNIESEGVVQITKAYFPAWTATIDGEKTEIDYKKNGLINIIVSEGKHEVSVNYQQSNLQKISNIISVISLMILLYLSIRLLKIDFYKYNLKKKI